MERIAIGFLAMTAEEFEQYTPRELQWRYEAEVQRENRHFERVAQLACWVINPWLGPQKLTTRDLLQIGPKKSEDWWNEE